MLQNPKEFSTAVQALLAAQQQSITTGQYADFLCDKFLKRMIHKFKKYNHYLIMIENALG